MASSKNGTSVAKYSSLVILCVNLLLFSMVVSPTNAATSCSMNPLSLSVCADALGGLVGVRIGQQAPSPQGQGCCSLLNGLLNVDAAVCLCTALRANVLGILSISLNLPLSIILNNCGMTMPPNFQCPST